MYVYVYLQHFGIENFYDFILFPILWNGSVNLNKILTLFMLEIVELKLQELQDYRMEAWGCDGAHINTHGTCICVQNNRNSNKNKIQKRIS